MNGKLEIAREKKRNGSKVMGSFIHRQNEMMEFATHPFSPEFRDHTPPIYFIILTSILNLFTTPPKWVTANICFIFYVSP